MSFRFRISFALALTSIFAASASAATISLSPSKDATIYQNNPNNGSGGGPGLFAGTNSGLSPRRALIAFDIASAVPAGATITGAQLTMVIGQIAGSGGGDGFQDPVAGLHAVSQDWGEADTGFTTNPGLGGTSQGTPAKNGDVTWNSAFHNSKLWTTAGGDFDPIASASLKLGNNQGEVSTWLSTPDLVSDVQLWLDSPATNFGWILVNTNETAAQTFRAFYSSDYVDVNVRPFLQVTYVIPEPGTLVLASCGALILGGMAPLRRGRSEA